MKDIIVSMTCLWLFFVSWTVLLFPEMAGQWKAKMEYAFLMEAEKIGMWSE